MGTFSEAVEVECAFGSRPVAVVLRGERYQVVSGRRKVLPARSPASDSGRAQPNAPEDEWWELEVVHALGARCTVSLSHHRGGSQWRVVRCPVDRDGGSLASLWEAGRQAPGRAEEAILWRASDPPESSSRSTSRRHPASGRAVRKPGDLAARARRAGLLFPPAD